MTGALNGLSDAALELERSAGDAARQDLALLIEELLQELGVLVVDVLDTALLETAVFLALLIYCGGSEITDFTLFLCHD